MSLVERETQEVTLRLPAGIAKHEAVEVIGGAFALVQGIQLMTKGMEVMLRFLDRRGQLKNSPKSAAATADFEELETMPEYAYQSDWVA